MRATLLAVLACVIVSGCHAPADIIPDESIPVDSDSHDAPPSVPDPVPPSHRANVTIFDETNQSHIEVDGGRTVAAGWSSGISDARRVTVSNQSAWEALWREHEGRRSPTTNPPAIDFDAERLIAVWAGDRPNTCHSIRITNVTLDTATNTTTVNVEEVGPDQSACFQAISQPFHIVAAPNGGTRVTFNG